MSWLQDRPRGSSRSYGSKRAGQGGRPALSSLLDAPGPPSSHRTYGSGTSGRARESPFGTSDAFALGAMPSEDNESSGNAFSPLTSPRAGASSGGGGGRGMGAATAARRRNNMGSSVRPVATSKERRHPGASTATAAAAPMPTPGRRKLGALQSPLMSRVFHASPSLAPARRGVSASRKPSGSGKASAKPENEFALQEMVDDIEDSDADADKPADRRRRPVVATATPSREAREASRTTRTERHSARVQTRHVSRGGGTAGGRISASAAAPAVAGAAAAEAEVEAEVTLQAEDIPQSHCVGGKRRRPNGRRESSGRGGSGGGRGADRQKNLGNGTGNGESHGDSYGGYSSSANTSLDENRGARRRHRRGPPSNAGNSVERGAADRRRDMEVAGSGPAAGAATVGTGVASVPAAAEPSAQKTPGSQRVLRRLRRNKEESDSDTSPDESDWSGGKETGKAAGAGGGSASAAAAARNFSSSSSSSSSENGNHVEAAPCSARQTKAPFAPESGSKHLHRAALTPTQALSPAQQKGYARQKGAAGADDTGGNDSDVSRSGTSTHHTARGSTRAGVAGRGERRASPAASKLVRRGSSSNPKDSGSPALSFAGSSRSSGAVSRLGGSGGGAGGGGGSGGIGGSGGSASSVARFPMAEAPAEDVEYLRSVLRDGGGGGGSGGLGFGQGCTVVMPPGADRARRARFAAWLEALGFLPRSAGGGGQLVYTLARRKADALARQLATAVASQKRSASAAAAVGAASDIDVAGSGGGGGRSRRAGALQSGGELSRVLRTPISELAPAHGAAAAVALNSGASVAAGRSSDSQRDHASRAVASPVVQAVLLPQVAADLPPKRPAVGMQPAQDPEGDDDMLTDPTEDSPASLPLPAAPLPVFARVSTPARASHREESAMAIATPGGVEMAVVDSPVTSGAGAGDMDVAASGGGGRGGSSLAAAARIRLQRGNKRGSVGSNVPLWEAALPEEPLEAEMGQTARFGDGTAAQPHLQRHSSMPAPVPAPSSLMSSPASRRIVRSSTAPSQGFGGGAASVAVPPSLPRKATLLQVARGGGGTYGTYSGSSCSAGGFGSPVGRKNSGGAGSGSRGGQEAETPGLLASVARHMGNLHIEGSPFLLEGAINAATGGKSRTGGQLAAEPGSSTPAAAAIERILPAAPASATSSPAASRSGAGVGAGGGGFLGTSALHQGAKAEVAGEEARLFRRRAPHGEMKRSGTDPTGGADGFIIRRRPRLSDSARSRSLAGLNLAGAAAVAPEPMSPPQLFGSRRREPIAASDWASSATGSGSGPSKGRNARNGSGAGLGSGGKGASGGSVGSAADGGSSGFGCEDLEASGEVPAGLAVLLCSPSPPPALRPVGGIPAAAGAAAAAPAGLPGSADRGGGSGAVSHPQGAPRGSEMAAPDASFSSGGSRRSGGRGFAHGIGVLAAPNAAHATPQAYSGELWGSRPQAGDWGDSIGECSENIARLRGQQQAAFDALSASEAVVAPDAPRGTPKVSRRSTASIGGSRRSTAATLEPLEESDENDEAGGSNVAAAAAVGVPADAALVTAAAASVEAEGLQLAINQPPAAMLSELLPPNSPGGLTAMSVEDEEVEGDDAMACESTRDDSGAGGIFLALPENDESDEDAEAAAAADARQRRQRHGATGRTPGSGRRASLLMGPQERQRRRQRVSATTARRVSMGLRARRESNGLALRRLPAPESTADSFSGFVATAAATADEGVTPAQEDDNEEDEFFSCGRASSTGSRLSAPMRPPAAPAAAESWPPALLARALRWVPEAELRQSVPAVNRAWAVAAARAYAEAVASLALACSWEEESSSGSGTKSARGKHAASGGSRLGGNSGIWALSRLTGIFPWGSFLAEGAFKQVFRVWNALEGRMEAISVMDVDAIEATGNEAVVEQELRAGTLASALTEGVGCGACPNFVRSFGVLRCGFGPPAAVWGSSDDRAPLGYSPGKLRLAPRPSVVAAGAAAAVVAAPGQRKRKGRAAGPATAAAALAAAATAAGSEAGRFLYIAMELCEHGDVEDFIRGQEDGLLELEEAQHFFFQMVFAVHAARTAYAMRHYDLKLLNFLLQKIPQSLAENLPLPGSSGGGSSSGGSSSGRGSSGGGSSGDRSSSLPATVAVGYDCGAESFLLKMPRERAFYVKLADFGTADVEPATLGRPVGIDHFTTLENTPPEQLVLGSGARQDFANDTFALGLAALHLFTGEAPYEEILEEVVCPPELRGTLAPGGGGSGLAGAWHGSSEYDVIAQVARSEAEEDSGSESSDGGGGSSSSSGGGASGDDDTLYDTFYRYLVLFGLPSLEARGSDAEGSPVWAAIDKLLSTDGPGRRGGKTAAAKCRRRFDKDRARFSLAEGSHPLVRRARERLRAADAWEAVLSMLAWDPRQRPTMPELLLGPAFAPLRSATGAADALEACLLGRFSAPGSD